MNVNCVCVDCVERTITAVAAIDPRVIGDPFAPHPYCTALPFEAKLYQVSPPIDTGTEEEVEYVIGAKLRVRSTNSPARKRKNRPRRQRCRSWTARRRDNSYRNWNLILVVSDARGSVVRKSDGAPSLTFQSSKNQHGSLDSAMRRAMNA